MPIRESERRRYPKDWPQISKRVRERADNKCEQCNAINGELIVRGEGDDAGTYMRPHGEVHCAQTGKELGMARGSEYEGRFVKIVLTVAHLDHQPENCADDNLKAWCQKCHLAYDAEHHRANAERTRRSRKACADMFDDSAQVAQRAARAAGVAPTPSLLSVPKE